MKPFFYEQKGQKDEPPSWKLPQFSELATLIPDPAMGSRVLLRLGTKGKVGLSGDSLSLQATGAFRSRKVVILRPGANLGFAGECNLGIRYALARGAHYPWLLKNDTVIRPKSLWHLISTATMAENKGIRPGIVGSTLRCFDRSERVQFDGFRVDYGGYEKMEDGQNQKTNIVPFVCGASMLLSRNLLQEAGLMDEDFFLFYEDNELCQRCSDRRFHVFHQPRSIVYHKGGAAIGGWLASSTSIFYATQNYIFIFKKGLLDRHRRMLLRESLWDGTVKSRENVASFCEGPWDFLLGGKGPRGQSCNVDDSCQGLRHFLSGHFQSLQRFRSRMHEREPSDNLIVSFLNLAFEG